MPIIRGKLIGEQENAMPLRRELRVLLWVDALSSNDWLLVEDLDRLRIYLKRGLGNRCSIILIVTNDHPDLLKQLSDLKLEVDLVVPPITPSTPLIATEDESLQTAVASASANDVDCIVVGHHLLPCLETIEEVSHHLLLDFSFLLRYAETFVRGFEIAWSFSHPVVNQTFLTLYQLSERIEAFQSGFKLLSAAQNAKCTDETVEAGRSLIYNRLANLCFTRDRLFFYVHQQNAARRNKAKRQTFAFETSYYLNFNYLLLYGAFDHAALLVNGILGLGLKSKDVGATYKGFLEALEKKSSNLHAIFTDSSTTELLERFGALRHYAAHRGSITPTKIVQEPETIPTEGEIDVVIADGQSAWVLDLPPSSQRDQLLAMVRYNTRAEIYEQNTITDEAVIIDIRGRRGIIHPLIDTPWNFQKITAFLSKIFVECTRILESPS